MQRKIKYLSFTLRYKLFSSLVDFKRFVILSIFRTTSVFISIPPLTLPKQDCFPIPPLTLPKKDYFSIPPLTLPKEDCFSIPPLTLPKEDYFTIPPLTLPKQDFSICPKPYQICIAFPLPPYPKMITKILFPLIPNYLT